MPRFFDDYSNTYLTHDSAAGRKQQRRGWKFRENFKVHCFVPSCAVPEELAASSWSSSSSLRRMLVNFFFCVLTFPSVAFFSSFGESNNATSSARQLHYQANMEDWRAGPMGLASAQQAYLRTRRNPLGQVSPEDMTVPPLPGGWKEELDEVTAVHYYVHDESGERSWVRPNFRPPGPGGPMMGGGTFIFFCSRYYYFPITSSGRDSLFGFVISHRKFYSNSDHRRPPSFEFQGTPATSPAASPAIRWTSAAPVCTAAPAHGWTVSRSTSKVHV